MFWLVMVQTLVLGALVKFDKFEFAVVLGFVFVFVWLNQIYQSVKRSE